MATKKKATKPKKAAKKGRTNRKWSLAQKKAIVKEYERAARGDCAGVLKKHKIGPSHIDAWRNQLAA